MRVAVGSQNPVKRDATEAAFEHLVGVTVTAESVASSVSEQPVGHDETVRGAESRARKALSAGAYDLGVGIEGGVAEFGDDSSGRRTWSAGAGELYEAELYLIMWAGVTDGNTMSCAAGPSVQLPNTVASRISDGEELGPVMKDEFNLENVPENQGAIGVLTGNVLDRKSVLRTAVAGALGQFVTDCY